MPSEPAEFVDLLSILSVPRPNGSRELEWTVERVRSWLEGAGIPVQDHSFVLRPYHMELLGLWLVLVGLLMPAAVVGRWGWGGLALALLALAVPLLEMRFLVPTVTGLIRAPARNLVVPLPANDPAQEVILCAHLDSKTELLDHYQRSVLLRMGPLAMVFALVCGLLMAADQVVSDGVIFRGLALLTALPVTIYGLGVGANLIGGRLVRQPSTGAVDDGAAVIALMRLGRRIQRRELQLDHTTVTLLLTVGEEAQMQGALAFVRDRYARDRDKGACPTQVINLEVVGQNGGYLLWERDGTAMISLPADAALNSILDGGIREVAGTTPALIPQINSDGFAFLHRGIPAATLGSFDLERGGRGLHSAQDSPARVDPARVTETEKILAHVLQVLDAEQGGSNG
jgi:hypothetical protein